MRAVHSCNSWLWSMSTIKRSFVAPYNYALVWKKGNFNLGVRVILLTQGGWSGGAMALGKLPVPGRPTIWITVGQGPTALTVGAGGGCLDIFTLIFPFSPLSPSLWETARYRLKYCLKGPYNPKQPTNQLLTQVALLTNSSLRVDSLVPHQYA